MKVSESRNRCFMGGVIVLEVEFVGNGVVAIASPGMTAEDATHGEIESFQRSMLLDSFHGVL